MTTGKFYGIGLGPGDPGLVTLKAAAILREVDCIFAAASRQSERSVSGDIIAALAGITAPLTELSFPMGLDWAERQEQTGKHAESILEQLDAGKNCAFVTIGDPLTYSTCGYLLQALKIRRPELSTEIIPGVNSWSALAAASGKILVEDQEHLRVVPGYIAPEPAELDRLLAEKSTVVLLKTYRSRNQLTAMLQERGADFIYGSNVGLADQFVDSDQETIVSRPPEYLSMLLIKPPRQEKHGRN